jgi:hypothetical protein
MSVTIPGFRCSDSARIRGERLQASALRYSRFLLLEVPGPWGRDALADSRLDPVAARQLAEQAKRAATRIVLIRRPGRQAAGPPFAWARASTEPAAERIHWGSWQQPADLVALDLSADVPPVSGPQRVALVCTNAKRDQCCAVAVAAAAPWDTWECSHLGGHRFAATALLLPSGEMFGRLDADSAIEVLRRFDDGEIALPHHRGRCGDPAMVQAALHAAAVRLGERRPGTMRSARWQNIAGNRDGDYPGKEAAERADIWEVDVVHADQPGGEVVYRVTVAGTMSEPALSSCADREAKSELRYEAVGFSRLR